MQAYRKRKKAGMFLQKESIPLSDPDMAKIAVRDSPEKKPASALLKLIPSLAPFTAVKASAGL